MPKKATFTPSGKVIEELTDSEVKAMADAKAVFDAKKKAARDAETQRLADAKTGNTKLLNLGLTQAEATALTGYKP